MAIKMQNYFSKRIDIIKILFLSFVVFSAAGSLLKAQDSSTKKSAQHEMKMDMNMKIDSSMKIGKKENPASPLAYKGVIDLKSIDKNKDGKVYQCPMDFNVLSDNPGIDPKCGMKLKEVSLKQAKKNLTSHGFKVK